MIIIVKQRVITAKHFLNVYAIKNSVQRKKNEEAQRRFLSNFFERITNDYNKSKRKGNRKRFPFVSLESKARPHERKRFSVC